MSPRFVAPYRHGGKNDGNDAEAICEAVRRPNMRFVPVKSLEQQAVLCLHRVHTGFIEERTATLNRVRGLLAEFGFVIARRSNVVHRAAPALLDRLPVYPARCLRDLLEHVRVLDERIKDYGREIAQRAKTDARGSSFSGAWASVRRLRLRTSPISAMAQSSRTDARSWPGSGWCPGNTPPAARHVSGISRGAAIGIFEPS
jgi:transposase